MKKKTKIILIALIVIALAVSLMTCRKQEETGIAPGTDDPNGNEFPITDTEEVTDDFDPSADKTGTDTGKPQDMTDPESLSPTPKADEGQDPPADPDAADEKQEEEQDPVIDGNDEPVEMEEIADW